MQRTAATLFLMTLLSACGGPEPAKRQPASCVPGEAQACPCPGQDDGVQSCLPSGTFEACVCGAPAGDVDVPDAGSATDANTGEDTTVAPDSSSEDAGLPDGGVDPGTPDMNVEPLVVVLVSPGADERNVTVDSPIRVEFDGPPDPASVQSRVQLSNAAGLVQASVTVTGNAVVVDPHADLEEFQTTYTIRVLAGITSGQRMLETDTVSHFSTRMFVADKWYAAGNAFHGVGYSLAITASNQCTIAVTDDSSPNQRFRFVPRDGGWIAYNSAPTAGGRALDAGDGTSPCAMLPLSATPDANQIWKFIANTSTAGTYWMQNNRFNETQSLDGTNSPPDGTAVPLMQATTDVPRQRWRWRRLP